MPGSTHDSRAFANSSLAHAISTGCIPEPYYLLGDAAYKGNASILTPYIGNDSTTFDLNMTPFTNVGNNSCSYNVAANLIYYRNAVANIDLSLEEILAPSKRWSNARFNPICGQPKIKIKNNGSLPVQGIKIIKL